MAVDFKAKFTRTSEYGFAPQDIVVKPKLNGRHELPDIQWLIDDIVDKGQLQPCVIRNEAGKPVLVAGFSRWRAISEINKKHLAPVQLSVRCCYSRCNEQEGFIANISENRVRNATTPLDDAHNISMLQKWGKTDEEIAGIYKASAAWVKKTAKLVTLEPEAQKAVNEGRLKPTAAAEIAKLTAEQQREAVKGEGKVKAPEKEKSDKPTSKQLRDLMTDSNTPEGIAALLKWILGDCPKSEVAECRGMEFLKD